MNIYTNELYQDAIAKIANTLPVKKGSFLITGATGLIGSCIIDTLLYGNQKLDCCFDIYALGRNWEKLEKRFLYAKDNKKLSFIIQDICQTVNLKDKIDYVIHGASNADPVSYSLYPVETILTNVYGITNILDFCKKNDGIRVMLLSTFETYGNTTEADVYTEEQVGIINHNLIRSGYPESKRCAELLLKSYSKEYGIDGVIGRLASIYGPTMLSNDSKAHAQFIRNGLKKEDIILKSKGDQKRTYCYVMDAVSAVFKILFLGNSGEAYNISNENSIATIAEVAKCVAQICGTKVGYDKPDEIEKQGFSKPQNCVLDNAKLKALGWSGEYTLYDGMKQTLEVLKAVR